MTMMMMTPVCSGLTRDRGNEGPISNIHTQQASLLAYGIFG